MAKIKIRIVNEVVDSIKHRMVSGLSGREYIFLADRENRFYWYEPKELPFELEDIFGSVSMPYFPWRFIPEIIEGEADGQKSGLARIAPFVTPDKYAGHELPELLALCADCGFEPKQRSDADAVKAQLDAYFMGRAVGEKAARSSQGADAAEGNPPPVPPKRRDRRVNAPAAQEQLEV